MSEAPPLIVHRRGDMLVAHGPMDSEIIRSFPASVPLRARLTQPRNPRAMRYYFALLSLVRENLPDPAPGLDTLHEAVKVMLGYTLTVKTPRGDVVLPGSVAFDKMTEPEFRQYLEAFKHLVVTRIIPGLDMPAFERAAREMMGDPLAPARRRAHRDAPPADAAAPPPEDDDEDGPFGGPPGDEDDDDGPPLADDDEDDGPPLETRSPEPTDAAPHRAEVPGSADGGAGAGVSPPPHVADTIRQLADRAARQKRPRELPPGLDGHEAAIWYAAYDAVAALPPHNPETGEVIEAEDDDADAEGLSGASERQDRLDAEKGDGAPEPPPSWPFEMAARECNDWPSLKQLLRDMRSDPEYGALVEHDRRAAVRAVWVRMGELTALAGREGGAPRPASDYDAMWLWMEFGAKTRSDLDAMWPPFWRGAAYSKATKDEQAAIGALLVQMQGALK